MKLPITATILATLSLATATPLEKRFDVSIGFHGANGESYSMLFPTDRTNVKITNPMVVYAVSSPGGGFCTLTGADGESVVIYGEDQKSLQVPQAMAWGSCGNN
ncbi:hypothetical protein EYZ11_006252 [Aspergillus tanneri]|uniref:Uncharacterized protein n=1 Tax=Aspergillus tanneri TaxID=1220188 RepID=A0A4S3JFY4_9EURO|nr:uncharacterized protein ATNIH1004_010901 [Aspergillus tanneri]KAA8641962.1 hypothetical protein ATNIH1004_010901 [Aspergillus tanneri]THC94279.1 hypothetical protein EYZ11_006252 [Aspergillus tanneri]